MCFKNVFPRILAVKSDILESKKLQFCTVSSAPFSIVNYACSSRRESERPAAGATGSIGSLDRGEIALVNRVTHGMSLLPFLQLTKAFISVERLAVKCEYGGLTLSHILSEEGLSPASCSTCCLMVCGSILNDKNRKYFDFLLHP